MQSMNQTENHGDKISKEEKRDPVSSSWKNELENRPVDSDLEKKQGDPLFDSLPSVPTEEPVHHTGKMARELPEYHQGEFKASLRTEVADATIIPAAIETTKEMLSDAKNVAQEKAGQFYESASQGAEILLDRAYEGEKYLEEKGKTALVSGEEYLENTVAPMVGNLLSSAYSAVAAATNMAIEKGKDGLHYLGKEAYELSDAMAEKTDEAIVKAKEVISEGVHIAADKTSQTAEYLNEKKDQVVQMAAEKAQETIESLVDAQYGAPVEYGTQDKPLSAEGFQDLEKAIRTFEKSASFHLEETKKESQPSEASQLLRDLADSFEAEKQAAKESALDFMKQENDEAEELRRIQLRAISQENKIQREKTFVRSISQDLTESLRASAAQHEKQIETEGASNSEMRPLLGEEPRSQITV